MHAMLLLAYVAAKATYIRLLLWQNPRSYGAEFVFFCLYVFLFVRHATMLGTESLDGTYTH